MRTAPLRAFLAILAILAASPLGAAAGWQFRATQAVVDPPILAPGTTAYGQWSPTATPAAQGDSTAIGYARPAIAGWSTPNFQALDTANPMQTYCVDAFHISAATVQRVSFSLNQGDWIDGLDARTAAANDFEYCVRVDVSKFASAGPFELRAVAYPMSGVPLVLQGGSPTTTPGVTNASSQFGMALPGAQFTTYHVVPSTTTPASACTGLGSTPCPDVPSLMAKLTTKGDQSGNTICIDENSPVSNGAIQPFIFANNSAMSTSYAWLTIQPCASATKSGVLASFTTIGRVSKLHLKGFSFFGQLGKLGQFTGKEKPYAWFDDIFANGLLNSAGAATGVYGVVNPVGLDVTVPTSASSASPALMISTDHDPNSGAPGSFITDTLVDGYIGGAAVHATLARNLTQTNNYDDLWSRAYQVVNSVGINNAGRAPSPTYVVTENIDSTHLRVGPPGVVDLYSGDCIENAGSAVAFPAYSSSPAPTGSGGNCNGNGATAMHVSGDPVQQPDGSTIVTLNHATVAAQDKFTRSAASHPDFWQGGSSQSNIILYRATANDRTIGQGMSFGTIMNWAVINVDWNNTNPFGYAPENILNVGANSVNGLFQGNRLRIGSRVFANSGNSDIMERTDDCTGTAKSFTKFTPTFDNSPTCQ